MKIHFYKYQATGNDFVMLDNRKGEYNSLTRKKIAKLCDRRFGIGGDGLIMLNKKMGFDFEMKYFNADGAPGSMCGNGGRCVTVFADSRGIHRDLYSFLASDGAHISKLKKIGASLKMQPVSEIVPDKKAKVLDTGSPHYILPVNDCNTVNVFTEGRKIRNSKKYAEKGINVNFVQRLGNNSLCVRTYERGVEAETYSCGTGVTAAALASVDGKNGKFNIQIKTKGGNLSVSFQKKENLYDDIWLSGPADFVFEGTVQIK